MKTDVFKTQKYLSNKKTGLPSFLGSPAILYEVFYRFLR